MKFLLLLILLFTYSTAFALIGNDGFQARILKVNDDNIFVLDRGIEDGVEPKDHIKITNQLGFIARAICLRTGMITSHWKIYRVINPEKISKDVRYSVRSIKKSQVPEKYANLLEEDFSEEFTDFTESELFAWAKKEDDEKLNGDLPKDMTGDPILEPKPTFADTNFDGEQFAEDFKRWTANLSFAPLSYTSVSNTSRSRNMNGAFTFENQGKKYNLEISKTRNESKVSQTTVDESTIVYDPTTFEPVGKPSLKETIFRSAEDEWGITFRIFEVIPRFEFNSSYSKSKSTNNGFTNNEDISITPLGMQITVVKGAEEGDTPPWTMGINPSYNKNITYNQYGEVNEETGITEFQTVTRTIGLGVTSNIAFAIGNVSVQIATEWSPQIRPNAPKKFSTGEVIMNNTTTINFPISQRLFGTVMHRYDYSFLEQYGPLQDQKTQQTTQFAFNYSIDL